MNNSIITTSSVCNTPITNKSTFLNAKPTTKDLLLSDITEKMQECSKLLFLCPDNTREKKMLFEFTMYLAQIKGIASNL